MKILQILGLGAALAFQLISAHQLSDEQILKEFTPYDLDQDQHISTNEMDTATRQQLKQFEDPYVSQQEMTQFVNDIVKSIMVNDVDQDGKLNFQEFATMMRNEHQHGGETDHVHSEESNQQADVIELVPTSENDEDESNEDMQNIEEVKGVQL